MKGTNIGEFEELVLLTVGILGEEAYGLSIKDDLENRMGRRPSIGALHSALSRLEDKGYVRSKMEGATADRRGRRKRFYVLSQTGIKVLQKIYDQRSAMIKLIPKVVIE